MRSAISKIDVLIKAIEIFLSKNRHVFLVEDIEQLKKCLTAIKRLRTAIIKSCSFSERHYKRLIEIVQLPDVFCGLRDSLFVFLEDLK